MFKKSFKGKIIVPAVLTVVVIIAILTVDVSMEFLHCNNELINEKTATDAQSLRVHIKNGEKHTEAAASSMARNREAINAVKNRDRESILQIFKPMCEIYRIDYFTITDENGIVLVRTYEFERADDSILNQHNVQDARNGLISTYLESGTRIQIAVRTGAPVYDTDGTLIGIISAGIRYDTDEAVDLMKEYFHSDVTIFLGESIIATTILDRRERRVMDSVWDSNVAKVVKEKTEYFGNTHVYEVEYKAFYMPLMDSNGEVFAVISVSYPLTEFKSQAKALIGHISIISIGGLAVFIMILYCVVSTISKPLVELSKEMNRMESGNLNFTIDSQEEDEVGLATKSLRRVAQILLKLIDNINVAITEHEKGNTGYQINISGFQGAYRLLAERIVELSSLGMEDQLTGMPNRRSFDNRLAMEWGRAMRERTSLCMLMIDVDHFKAFNDTYGHQQGDVALQMVAKTIPLPLRRSSDFTARWGGEEFAVLLPNTNSEGASRVAENIRLGIENAEIPNLDGGLMQKVTVSIGVGSLIPRPKDSVDKLIAHADAALYHAKKTGRNKVCRYEDGG